MPPIVLGLLVLGIVALAMRERRAPAQNGGSPPPPPGVPPSLPPVQSTSSRYAPGSTELTLLFSTAAPQANVPATWASDPALHSIVARESDGWVGRPNFQFGAIASVTQYARWPEVWRALQAGDAWRALLVEPYKSGPRGEQSSATGLGQLTTTNLDTMLYYPLGRYGIGIPIQEAIGMLRYIKARYQTPSAAFAFGMRTGKWTGY